MLASLEFPDVQVAVDGLEATTRVIDRGERYAFILMDVNMPNKDGNQATRETTAHYHQRDVSELGPLPTIIAMTANALLETERRECLSAGTQDFIFKPVLKDHLADVLSLWWERRHHAQAASSGPPSFRA